MSLGKVNMPLDIAERAKCIGKPFITGGDFNAGPQELEEAVFLKSFDCSVWAPTVIACTTGCRLIDYFLVSNLLKPRRAQTEPSIPMSSRAAVSLEFEGGLSQPRARIAPVPRLFPAVRPLARLNRLRFDPVPSEE